ncbi:hypothetical protein K438DRAFT_1764405 [Mycena galopus ATCC 62051]|nr:hypothetical protein K438DRAFT_1764405 [Mycena galopus ATCC 62051]
MAALTNVVLVAFTGNPLSLEFLWLVDEPTAGRIWLKLRDATHVGAHTTLKSRYNTVIVTVVESGALYCLSAILLVIMELKPNTTSSDIGWFVIQSASTPLINILPTLIIVRAAMGHNIQDKMEPPRAARTTGAHSVVK